MSDVMRMQLDIQSNLEKEVQKSSKAMKGFNSLVESASAKFENIVKTVGSKLVGAFKTVEKAIGKIIPGFIGLFSAATILDAVRAVFEMDKAMTQLSYRMGHGADGVGVLKNAVFETTSAIGIATEDAQVLVGVLTEMRVPLDMMKELTVATGAFSELTGMAGERAAELAGSLVTVGRMSEDSVTGMMNGMVQVQRAVGFTTNEMNTLGDSITSSTQMLNTMGKTAAEIEGFNKGVVKLAGAFASVGLEASRATELVDDLLDPSKVEENAFLLSQLGVSMGEAFSGDLDPAELARGFRDIGQNLQNMTGPAAAAMAEQLGMSVREARQLGELSDTDLQKVATAMSEGADATEAMQEALQEERTPMQKFEAGMERFKGMIGEVAMRIMPFLEKGLEFVANALEKGVSIFGGLPGIIKVAIPLLIGGVILLTKFLKKRFLSVATNVGANLASGVKEGISQGAEKGALALNEKFEDPKAIDLRVRTRQGPGYERMMKDAELWEARAATSLVGPVKRLAEGTAAWKKTLADSAKPMSKLEQSIQASSENSKARYNSVLNEKDAMLGSLDVRKSELSTQIQTMRSRRKYLENLEASGQAQNKEKKELANIRKMTERLSAERSKLDDEKITRAAQYTAMEMNNFDALTNQQKIEYGKQAKSRLDAAKAADAALKSQLTSQQSNLDKTNAAVNALRNKKNLTAEEAVTLHNLTKIQDEQRKNVEEITLKQSQSNAELLEANKIMEDFEQKTEGVKLDLLQPDEIRSAVGAVDKIREKIGMIGNNIGASFKNAGSNLLNSARTAAQAVKERINPKNWMAGIKNFFKKRKEKGEEDGGDEKRNKKRGSPFKMLLGPLALIGGMLMSMKPVQEALGKMMEQVKIPLEKMMTELMPVVQMVLDQLMPIFQGIVNAVMPIIKSLITSLMPILQTIISALMPIIMKLVDVMKPILDAIVKALGPILEALFAALMPLIDMLLPPLLWVLGALVEIVGRLISVIGSIYKFLLELPERFVHALPKFLGGGGGEGDFEASMDLQNNAVYRVVDAVTDMGNDLADAGKAMRETAFDPASEETQSMFAESTAEGVADGMATNEKRTTWEPAQIRALREGIRVERDLESVTTGGGGSPEVQSANNTAAAAESSRVTAEVSARELNFLEQESLRSQERHDQMMSVLSRLNSNMNNATPNPVSGGL